MWRIGTDDEPRCAAPARPRIAALRRRAVTARLIFLNRVTNQSASRRADAGADQRAPNSSPTGDITNDRARTGTSRCACSGRRIARIKIHRDQRDQ